MSSETLSKKAGRIKPVAKPKYSGKPLSYFANLSVNIETAELTQEELREFIAGLLVVSSGEWRFIPCAPISMPEWVKENWEVLLQDPIGVIKWSVQFLTNESVGDVA